MCLLQRNIKLPGGCHKGELTKLGQQQARKVGDWLRDRYIHQLNFLPSQYKVPLPCHLLNFCAALHNILRVCILKGSCVTAFHRQFLLSHT